MANFLSILLGIYLIKQYLIVVVGLPVIHSFNDLKSGYLFIFQPF